MLYRLYLTRPKEKKIPENGGEFVVRPGITNQSQSSSSTNNVQKKQTKRKEPGDIDDGPSVHKLGKEIAVVKFKIDSIKEQANDPTISAEQKDSANSLLVNTLIPQLEALKAQKKSKETMNGIENNFNIKKSGMNF